MAARPALLVVLSSIALAACSVAFPLDKYRADPIDGGEDATIETSVDDASFDTREGDTREGDTRPGDGAAIDSALDDTLVTDSGSASETITDSCGSGYLGAKLVRISAAYCIEETEVTNAAYDAFLAAGVPTQKSTGKPDFCSWNDSWGAPVVGFDAYPVVNVDWCDAYGYCAWAGKRLCGNATGGTLDPGQEATPFSEWYYACANGDAKSAYPYGASFGATTCNGDGASGTTSAVAVRSFPDCHGTTAPFDRLFDMSGNVDEWEDGCYLSGATSADDSCDARGGSYASNPAGDLACDHLINEPRNNTDPRLGFRCCSK